MMKCKIFSGTAESVEKQINEWLTENDETTGEYTFLQSQSYAADSTMTDITVTIFYLVAH